MRRLLGGMVGREGLRLYALPLFANKTAKGGRPVSGRTGTIG